MLQFKRKRKELISLIIDTMEEEEEEGEEEGEEEEEESGSDGSSDHSDGTNSGVVIEEYGQGRRHCAFNVAKGDATSDQLGHWLSCGFPGIPQKLSDEYGATVVQNEVGGDSFDMLINSNDVEGLTELRIASGIMTAWNKLGRICNVGQRPKQPEPDPEPELEFEDEVESSVVVGGGAAIEIQMTEHLLIRSDTNLTGLKGVYLTDGLYQAKCYSHPCCSSSGCSFSQCCRYV
jgi:hypothetical protein